MAIDVGRVLYVESYDRGRVLWEVESNDGECPCGENDRHSLVVIADRNVGLDGDFYIMPDERVNTGLSQCGKELEAEIKARKIRLCSEAEGLWRFRKIEQSNNPEANN
jgi:hypothetical protein